MSNYKKLIAVALIGLVAVVGVVVSIGNAQAQVEANDAQGFSFEQVVALFCVTGAFPKACPEPVVEEPVLGSVVGPDTYFTYTANNDYKRFEVRQALNGVASSTICSIRSPREATSTLIFAGLRLQGSTTAAYVDIGKDDTFNGTSTIFASTTIAANINYFGVLNNFSTSTTEVGGLNFPLLTDLGPTNAHQVFAPGVYFNINAGGGPSDSAQIDFQYSGSCAAEFIVFN